MPRYVLIDRNSGYVWGDSAAFAANRQSDLTPIEAARLLDESIGRIPDVDYEETGHDDPAATYDVYRADIGGAEAIPVITDGQDPGQIESVRQGCQYVVAILRFPVSPYDRDA